jgi:proteasome component ECM29
MDIDSAPQVKRGTPPPVVENLKALLQFINWVATVGLTTSELQQLSVFLTDALKGFMQEYLGWPEPQTSKQTVGDIDLRNHTYETIGILVKAHPKPSRRIVGLLGWLLESLAQDHTKDVVIYLNGAVSAITSVFRPQEEDIIDDLVADLTQWMVRPGSSPRHAAAKIANDCIPFNNIHARWIDILACAGSLDARTDVVEEGHRGLDPWTYYRHFDGSRTLPDWRKMGMDFFTGDKDRFFKDGPRALLQDHGSQDQIMTDATEQLPVASSRLDGKWAKALAVAISYCQKILYLTALPDFPLQPGWERQLEVLVSSDKKTRDAIQAYLADGIEEGGDAATAMMELLKASLDGVRLLDDNVAVAESAARSFCELASLTPVSILEVVSGRAGDVHPLLSSSRTQLRLLGAKALGIIGSRPSGDDSGNLNLSIKADIIRVSKGIKTAKGFELSGLEGTFLGAAHLLSRQLYYGTVACSEVDQEILLGVPLLSDVPSTSLDFFIEAFIQLWTAGIPAFGIPTETTERYAFIEKAFINPLIEQAKKGKENAIKALGRLAIASDVPVAAETSETNLVDLILSKLYELHEVKQAEVHLAVGEAIAAAVACWDSEAVQLTLDVQSGITSFQIPKRSGKLVQVLDKLLTDSKNTKPSLVKASGMWLFCIIQYCSHLEEVQSRLRDCHVAFMRLLTARDELVQETASRALALIYEKGGASLKDQLVRDFTLFFTGSGQQLKVDEETETAESSASASRAGKSTISYKDIVRLANEAGDQSLVYKFMSLANSAINWSSQSAFGRFGLRDILSNPEVGVDPKLYPILFRSQFDPSAITQKSMRAIWGAMVKDSNAVLDTHFDDIMRSLLKSMLGREWRVRQASCAAIKDLIDSRPFKKYQPYYKDMLAAALKLLDDMKDSVRQAALALFSYLTHSLLKQLEDNG